MHKYTFLFFCFTAALLIGCAPMPTTQIKDYAQSSADQAETMLVLYDRCMNAEGAAKNALCGALKDSILSYRRASLKLLED